jgi:hypothetical protein
MRTSELTGAALDWAVAKCEGKCEGDFAWYYDRRDTFNYSTDWAQGGPIIERENICLWTEGYDWEAKQYGVWEEWGASPLIAAMRCYVGSKLGNEVEIPNELTGVNK